MDEPIHHEAVAEPGLELRCGWTPSLKCPSPSGLKSPGPNFSQWQSAEPALKGPEGREFRPWGQAKGRKAGSQIPLPPPFLDPVGRGPA